VNPFYIYSTEGNAGFLTPRLRQEGRKATLYTSKPGFENVLRGYVPRQTVADVPAGATVLFDDVGLGRLGSFFRGRGHAVIGGNPFDRDLEIDRASGVRIADRHGIAIPPTHNFARIPDAIRFLEANEGAYFLKVSGNRDCSHTENAPSASRMIRHLRWAAAHAAEDFADGFVLQEKVDGIEIDCDGWFDGRRFVPPFCCTIEDKKFLPDDLGPRVGCATNVVTYFDDEHPPYAAATVGRLADLLREKKYVGNIACNTILASDGTPHFLEWSARCGFDALQAFSLLIPEDTLADQLDAFAHGKLPYWSLRDDARLALTVRVSIPPYPSHNVEELREAVGRPLDARLDGTHPRILPAEVMKGPDGLPCFAGGSGFVATVGATGNTIADVRTRALELANDLDVPSKQFNPQLVPRFERALAALRDFGYLDGDSLKEAA
jgi:phosphoribosylamine---glycine ligase